MGSFSHPEQHEDEAQEGADVSAAASGTPGPPPMAVALVSSFYTQEQHPLDRQQQLAGTHVSTKPVGAAALRTSSLTSSQEDFRLTSYSNAMLMGSQVDSMMGSHLDSSNLPIMMGSQSDAITVPCMMDDIDEAGEVPEAEEDTFLDGYAGGWHRPAKFGDAIDADKSYYEYDNRMSYEYR